MQNTRMFIAVIVLLIYCTEVDGIGTDYQYSRSSLRRLLQEHPLPTLNMTSSSSPDFPLIALQVVDEQGLVIDRVSTNQKIRLRVQALTTAEYQAPFVKKCWYGLHSSYPIDRTDTQGQVIFLNEGCGDDSILLKTSELPLKVNGPLEVHTSLFNLMPLYNEQFSVLDIHCETSLCHVDASCRVDCSKGRARVWKMDGASQIVEASVAVRVDKRKHTQPPTTPKLPSLDDFLIRGGRKHSVYARQTAKPAFLNKYQPYIAIVTMCVTLLLLACMIGIGYMYISYKNKKKYADVTDNLSQDHVTGYHDNKITDFPNYAGTIQGGLHGSSDRVISPPPAYNNAGFLSTSDAKARTPISNSNRERLTANEASLLDTRLMSRNPLHPVTRPQSVQKQLYVETEHRDRDRLTASEAATLEARLQSRTSVHPVTRPQSVQRQLDLETEHIDQDRLTASEAAMLDARLQSRIPVHPATRPQSVQRQLDQESEHRDRDRLTASEAAMLDARLLSRTPVHPATRPQSVQRQLDQESDHRDRDRLTASEAAMLDARLLSRTPVHPATRPQSVQRQLDQESDHRDRNRLTASEAAVLDARMLARTAVQPGTMSQAVQRQLDIEAENRERDRLTVGEAAMLDARLLSRTLVHPVTRTQSVQRQMDLESEHGDRLTASEPSLLDARLLSRIPVHPITRPQPRQIDQDTVHRERNRLTASEAALWEPRQVSRNPEHTISRHQSVQRQLDLESEHGDRNRLTASESALWEPRQMSRAPVHPITRTRSVQRQLDQESEHGDQNRISASEDAMWEPRQLSRTSVHPITRHQSVQRHLDQESEHGDISVFREDTAEHDHGGSRLQRGQLTPWVEPQENFREPADTGPTPVGGEWYTGRTGRYRSSSTDQLIQTSQGRASLIQIALKDYFNKYGM